ncbi:hypothetical protein [Nocardia sp. NPDC019255]|uniref:hypothetical protein n=1 Tax=Nocardia sp. NPDC019255 TaxID=3154591 RepID=UPI0033FA1DF1
MPDRATELATTLQATEQAVRELSQQVGINEVAVRRAKFAAKAALVGIVLDSILTVLVGLGLFGVDHNQDRINDLQTTQQVETQRNKAAMCAFITLFLQFEPRTTTNPAYSEQQRAQQIQAYGTLRQIGLDLGCGK